MQLFTLSTDSTCDLYHDFLAENDIPCAPLTFTLIEKDGKMTEYYDDFREYGEYVDFYNKLRSGVTSKTAMLNYDAHVKHFTMLAQRGAKDVLHFTISSGLARTHEVAEQAAAEVKREYPELNVVVADPLTATVGQGALVRLALKCRNEGKSVQEAYDYVMKMRQHIQHYIIADDLNYLYRGGRLSALSAAVGGVLNVKPVISFDKEGKLFTLDKVRGTKKAISYIKQKMEKDKFLEPKAVFIVHTDNEPAANELADYVRERFGIEPYVSIMGPVIGTHVGPNAFALGYLSVHERTEI